MSDFYNLTIFPLGKRSAARPFNLNILSARSLLSIANFFLAIAVPSRAARS